MRNKTCFVKKILINYIINNYSNNSNYTNNSNNYNLTQDNIRKISSSGNNRMPMQSMQSIPKNIYNDKYQLNDDDKRKIKTIEQCILTCISASSLSSRIYNKFSGESSKDYRNMLVRRALLNVLKKQKEEGGLGAVSASRTFMDNSMQLAKVGYAKLSGRGGKQSKKGRSKKIKINKNKKSRKNKK